MYNIKLCFSAGDCGEAYKNIVECKIVMRGFEINVTPMPNANLVLE